MATLDVAMQERFTNTPTRWVEHGTDRLTPGPEYLW